MLEQNQRHDWIEKVKSQGAFPYLLEPDQCSSGWSSPPGDIFMVRGADFVRTKKKTPGGDYLLRPLGFDWIRGPTKISELLNNPKSRVRRVLDEECLKGCGNPFVWAFNFQVPSKENHSLVLYFASTEPIQEDSLVHRFIKGDDEFRKSRLKLIANVVKGPWIVKKAVGEKAISVIGRVLTCKYYTGENFLEVDIDAASSMLATAVAHLALGYFTTLTVDLAFVIEGQTESELPERILGALRFFNLDPAAASQVELPPEGSSRISQSSLPNRFWKSIGHGITHLIHPVAQGSGSYGAVDHDTSSEDARKP